jgi:VWFA-related protein
MRARLSLLLLAIPCSFLLLSAQTSSAPGVQSASAAKTAPAPTDQVPVIRATSGEVLLDMVVRDKHRHIVTDLSPSDVEVYEDGVRQDIKSFRLVQGAEELQTEQKNAQAKSAPNGGATAAAPASQTKLPQLNFVSIVFAPTAPLNREFAREAVLDFLKSDSLPNTFVTIYALGYRLNLVQPYTADKNVLTAAVNKVSKGLFTTSNPNASAGIASNAIATTLGTAATSTSSTQATTSAPDPMLGQFSGAIATSPLWARNAAAQDASTNLGAALEAQALLSMSLLRFDSAQGLAAIDALRELVHSQAKLPGRKVVLYLSDGLAFPVNRREMVDNLISLANRSGVTFYTVDTRGLSVEGPMVSGLSSMEMTGAESRQRGAVTSQNPVSGVKEMDDVALTSVSNTQQSMQELAESTGGFAVANTNQIAEPMERVMEDIRTHYELSYVPKSTNYDGHFRKIEVKLTRPKLTVQTRKGYYALPMLDGEPLQAYEAAALDKINTRPAPTDFPYNAALMRFRANQSLVEYMAGFEIPISGLKAVAVPKTDKSRVQASIVALVRDSNGEVVDKISRELWRYVSPQGLAEAGDHIFFSQPLVLPRGRYTVDVAVTDEESGKASVQRLAVPAEPPVGGLGLSSLEVVAKAEPLKGPGNPMNPFQLENVVIMPELGDSVSAGPVTLYFVVYPAKLQTPADTDVTLDLLRDGKALAHQPLHVPEPRADGSIPMVVRVSPGPGSYAIVVTARQGKLLAQAARSLQIE